MMSAVMLATGGLHEPPVVLGLIGWERVAAFDDGEDADATDGEMPL